MLFMLYNLRQMERQKKRKKVYVAMSGGVDSSVAAALLKKRGFNVVGVYMKQWTPEIFDRECLWKRDREDAMRVAASLNIPFKTWDFSKEYEKQVAKYMINSYRKGITPNPDIMCNKVIKFGLFFKKAIEEGANYIATGHYAKSKNGHLFTAKDKNKDQTYFLWTLTERQLKKTMFPIGNFDKREVRKFAKKFKLVTADKKDSQGVCFIGELNMKNFLKSYIEPRPGKVLNLDGEVIGRHDGAFYYTIGQRRGLNLGIAGGPYYVVKKDIKRNLIYVGQEKDLALDKAFITEVHWIGRLKKQNLKVKIRYRTKGEKAILKLGALKFKKPIRAITAGQSAVFYSGTRVLGGAIIK